MSFWESLKTVGRTVPGVAPAIGIAEEGIEAHQKAKQQKRERRVAALSAVAATFKNPPVLAVLILCILVFLYFAPPESKAALMDFLKFFTG